jgi:hypothetical protein
MPVGDAAELIQETTLVAAGGESVARTEGCGVFANAVGTHVASWPRVMGFLRQHFAVR